MREFKYSAEQVLHLIRTKKDAFWSRLRETQPLKLFHEAARRVPAYKDFLKKNRVNPAKIRTFKDFQLVPPVNKKNYLRQYPLEKLCWDGTLKKPLVFTSTSGSTGEPFYFPRSEKLEWQSSIYHELFLLSSQDLRGKSILVIVGFGMGVWIGGLITYQAFKNIAKRGYKIGLLTPGPNKKEIFEVLRSMKNKFERIILCGYPPFIKDILDEAGENGIKLADINLKIIFAAEAFSDQFRQYITKKANIRNSYTDMMNIYGSADMGTMAEETPLSILAREISLMDPNIYKNLFNDAVRTPTLAQFNPLFINFDIMGKAILCTGDNALPLIRYDIGDHGGALSFKEVVKVFDNDDINLLSEARKRRLGHSIFELPFVYIYERSDFSTKLYGAIIYPEHIRDGLLHHHLDKFITGKFTMLTKTDFRQNEYLEINLELKPKARPSRFLRKRARELIIEKLLEKNAEYKNNHSLLGKRVYPKIIFWKHQHPQHFKQGIKQKWVKK